MVNELFYLNDDNNRETLHRQNRTGKVRLHDQEFKRLILDVEDA